MPPKLVKTRSVVDKKTQYIRSSRYLPENDLPTLRSCLQHILHLKDLQTANDRNADMVSIMKETAQKVMFLFSNANAKFVEPVTLTESSVIQKLNRAWSDVDIVVRNQKGYKKVDVRISKQLDKFFDILHCQCSIQCFGRSPCSDTNNCSHVKLVHCEKDTACKLDNCSHNKFKSCVVMISCESAGCGHKMSISCACPKECKLPLLDLFFVRAQRLKTGAKSAYCMLSVDNIESAVQNKTINRKENENERSCRRGRLDEE